MDTPTTVHMSSVVTDHLDEIRRLAREYGVERLVQSLNAPSRSEPAELVNNCVGSLQNFRGNGSRADDLTIMAIQFAA